MPHWMGRRARFRRGNGLVEFVFMLPFYCAFFFGALEFCQLFQYRVQLSNACSEGVIAAAAGKTLAEVREITQTTASQLGITDDQISIEYNTATDGSGSWVAAADSGSTNDIPSGNPCRVLIDNWQYDMVTGGYFTWTTASGGKYTMDAKEILIRE
jgi:Flp pilus assembly protein TadG